MCWWWRPLPGRGKSTLWRVLLRKGVRAQIVRAGGIRAHALRFVQLTGPAIAHRTDALEWVLGSVLDVTEWRKANRSALER